MSAFYPPYQFIPVTGKINGEKIRAAYEEIKNGTSEQFSSVRHDLWVDGAHSGRMICSVTLNSPTVVGNKHETDRKTGKKRIIQYQWKGKLALPANSLKGVISSMAEALSQSALRVLDADEEKEMRVLDESSRERDGKKRVSVPKTVHQYFDHIDEEMKPWQKDRHHLTVAELLFGVVEVNEKDSDSKSGQNLRGRLRFSDARATTPVTQLQEITLKLLGEPKTPCPSMYYHVRGQRGRFLSKEQMYAYPDSEQILPNGRKYYLHHPESQRNNRPWETGGNPKQEEHKFLCSPLQAGQTFYFHIDFENLCPAELTLLRTAVQPDETFQHRLGLGKPLGLGSVTIRTEGIFLIDRKGRYAMDALNAARYHRAGIDGDRAWQSLYPDEDRVANNPKLFEKLTDTRLIDKETLKIACTIGNPGLVRHDHPVRTPILSTQENAPEEKSYEWFNKNDNKGNQAMPEIVPNKEMPFLYADMSEARRSKRFSVADLSFVVPVEKPEQGIPDILQTYLENHPDLDLMEVAISKDLATYLRDKISEDQRGPVCDWLIEYWVRKGIFLTSRVERIYDKICPDWRKRRSDLVDLHDPSTTI